MGMETSVNGVTLVRFFHTVLLFKSNLGSQIPMGKISLLRHHLVNFR